MAVFLTRLPRGSSAKRELRRRHMRKNGTKLGERKTEEEIE